MGPLIVLKSGADTSFVATLALFAGDTTCVSFCILFIASAPSVFGFAWPDMPASFAWGLFNDGGLLGRGGLGPDVCLFKDFLFSESLLFAMKLTGFCGMAGFGRVGGGGFLLFLQKTTSVIQRVKEVSTSIF